jgi:peptide/nickel transport system substrate-binding protein
MKNVIVKLMTVIMVSSFLLCGTWSPCQAGKDSLVYAINTKISSLDRYATTIPALINLWYLIGDPLLTQDPKDLKPAPWLVTEWKQIDPVTWEFKLRPGVLFHSGNEFTAESVRFTVMDVILDPARKSPNAGSFNWIKMIQVIDKHSFRIVCHNPYPVVLYRLAELTPYDPEYFKTLGWEQASANPVGTGPYKMKAFLRDQKVDLVANEIYWQKGLPHIKNVTFKVIPEISTRIAELRAGSVDLIQTLEPDKTDQVTSDPNLKVVSGPISRFMFWQFDASGRAGETPVTNIKVRQAIGHAIDRAAIIKNMLKGYGDLSDVPCSRLLFGYDQTAKGDFAYDPVKAKALLAEAGYPNGLEIDLWQYDGQANLLDQAAMGYLQEVGIKVRLRDYVGNIGQMITLRNTGKITGIACYNWGVSGVFDADALLSAWFKKGDPKNYNPDPELDQWLNEANQTTDQNKRLELFSKVQKKIVQEVYWLPMYDYHQVLGAKKNLEIKVEPYELILLQKARWID